MTEENVFKELWVGLSWGLFNIAQEFKTTTTTTTLHQHIKKFSVTSRSLLEDRGTCVDVMMMKSPSKEKVVKLLTVYESLDLWNNIYTMSIIETWKFFKNLLHFYEHSFLIFDNKQLCIISNLNFMKSGSVLKKTS